jgi:hypothetical protein
VRVVPTTSLICAVEMGPALLPAEKTLQDGAGLDRGPSVSTSERGRRLGLSREAA